MNHKISVNIAITIAIIAMSVTFSITMIVAMRLFNNTVSSVNEKESQYTKLSEVDRYVRANEYYDINDDTLNDMLASGYVLGTGDRYARYYTAQAYTNLLNVQSGKSMGIGVDVANDPSSGYGRITKVYSESPAEELGLQVGGYLTVINGVDVRTLTSRDAILSALRDEEGTSVAFTYLDPTMAESSYEITRRSYAVPTVDSQMLAEDCGYVSISDFTEETPSDFSYAVNRLVSNGAKSLVVDLRGNSSTNLTEAISCIDVVAPEGDVAYAVDKNGTQTLLGDSDESCVTIPVVCLVNGATANAAELFAASVQQLNGGRIVGEHTVGKGVVMGEPRRMSDGSAVVITVAQLVLGDGTTSFDSTGVSLDTEVALGNDEYITLAEDLNACDSQLRRSVEVARNLAANNG